MQIGDKFYKPVDDSTYLEASEWCNNNNAHMEDKTEYYEIVQNDEPTVTVKDYDDAMEAYIKSVRVDRGYTTREPSDYKDDPNARWAQDALDFIDFRSRVMTYGLEIQNKFIAGEEVPTLEEFKEHLKTIKCEWTYNTTNA